MTTEQTFNPFLAVEQFDENGLAIMSVDHTSLLADLRAVSGIEPFQALLWLATNENGYSYTFATDANGIDQYGTGGVRNK